uniref:FLYWCH-type domain-containing protein n=1 Tax=Globodera rostochiensis TaxID=31243 RepID=A0A914IFM3_GLORO
MDNAKIRPIPQFKRVDVRRGANSRERRVWYCKCVANCGYFMRATLQNNGRFNLHHTHEFLHVHNNHAIWAEF